MPAIRKMVIGGRRVAKISFIPPGRGPHWKLENQCLVNFKSCKSVEINGTHDILNMVFEDGGVHTKQLISQLVLILDR